MSPVRRAALALPLILAACGLGPGAKIGQPVLRGDDINRLVRGQTFAGTTAGGGPIEIYYRADDTVLIRGRNAAGIAFQDTGWWWVQADRLCTRYEKVRGRKSTCEWVTQQARDIGLYEPGGNLAARGQMYAGAPKGVN